MQTMEWMLVFGVLLACAFILMQPISFHYQKMEKHLNEWKNKNNELECSVLFENAISHYTQTTAQNCFFYPYTIHTPPNPLDLYLGMDSNHYE